MKTKYSILSRFAKTGIRRLLGGLGLAFLAGVFMAGCPNGDDDSMYTPPQTKVYLAGSISTLNPNLAAGALTQRACYWADGTKYFLGDDGTAYSAAAITVSGGNIYIAGTYPDSNDKLKACLWVADVNSPEKVNRYDLSTDAEFPASAATAVTVDGNTVYIAGHQERTANDQSQACYWTFNGTTDTKKDLNTESTISQSYAYCIAVSEGKVYVGGQMGVYGTGNTFPWNTCWWADDEPAIILDSITTTQGQGKGIYAIYGIAVSEGKVYAANNNGKYWIDGEITTLSTSIAVKGIVVSNGTVYTANLVTAKSAGHYWINEKQYRLDDSGGRESEITSLGGIAVSNGKVYVGGAFKEPFALDNFSQDSHVCYWADGKRIDIPGSYSGKVNSIAVTD